MPYYNWQYYFHIYLCHQLINNSIVYKCRTLQWSCDLCFDQGHAPEAYNGRGSVKDTGSVTFQAVWIQILIAIWELAYYQIHLVVFITNMQINCLKAMVILSLVPQDE